jgi:hypothetical protein
VAAGGQERLHDRAALGLLRRTETIQGDPGVQLAGYLQSTVTVPAAVLAASQVEFTLPPALEDAPAGSVYTGGYVEPVGGGSAPAAAGGATAVSLARNAKPALTRTPAVSVR